GLEKDSPVPRRRHSRANRKIVARQSLESTVVLSGTVHHHGCAYVDVSFCPEFNFIEVGDGRGHAEIRARAASVEDKLTKIREADTGQSDVTIESNDCDLLHAAKGKGGP